MNTLPKIAVLGLFNSGSTALAGALHRLGVHMGAPYWSGEHANFYEPWDLACMLRQWWNEPDIKENTDRQTRIACLANWLRLRQRFYQTAVGAKHPLLCLCANDLVAAWGEDTVFLRIHRPLDESIERLRVRSWHVPVPCVEQIQRRLWQSTEEFCARQPHFLVEFRRLRSNPAAVLREIVDYARLSPTADQAAAAAAFIR